MKHELIKWHPASDPPKTGGNFLLRVTIDGITYTGTYDTTDSSGFGAVKGDVHEWAEFPLGPSAEADELVRKAAMADELAEALECLTLLVGLTAIKYETQLEPLQEALNFVRKLLVKYLETHP